MWRWRGGVATWAANPPGPLLNGSQLKSHSALLAASLTGPAKHGIYADALLASFLV